MEINKLLEELYSYSLFGIKLGLENIKKICDYLGNPEKKYKIIHITGTNGKGSTSTIVETVLLEAGYSVGKYTSPHILKFNERIRANGKDITDKDIALSYAKVKEAVENLGITPTFFEVTTAMMFLYFAEKKVQYAVLEVGMGGRYDATNVADGDIIAKKISERADVINEIVEIFGKDILSEDGKIDRIKMKNIVFSDKSRLKELNGIIHPKVLEEFKKIKEKTLKNDIIIFDIPLLFEAGMDTMCDKIILVYADRETQIERIKVRDGVSRELAEKIIDAQMSLKEKKNRSQIHIENNGTQEELRKKIEDIYRDLKGE